MVGIKAEVTYYGKEMKVDPKTRKPIKHRTGIELPDNDDWKESYRSTFEDILKFEGISEIRFFVPERKRKGEKV